MYRTLISFMILTSVFAADDAWKQAFTGARNVTLGEERIECDKQVEVDIAEVHGCFDGKERPSRRRKQGAGWCHGCQQCGRALLSVVWYRSATKREDEA